MQQLQSNVHVWLHVSAALQTGCSTPRGPHLAELSPLGSPLYAIQRISHPAHCSELQHTAQLGQQGLFAGSM